jgi:predicted short-subunit dehydrogenase-like oxidoreductase (DUF2520 family)
LIATRYQIDFGLPPSWSLPPAEVQREELEEKVYIYKQFQGWYEKLLNSQVARASEILIHCWWKDTWGPCPVIPISTGT